MMKWIAIVPALNEATRIAPCVQALYDMGCSGVWVVNDGSIDDTEAIAQRAGARVISLDRNRGKGAALAMGITHAPEWADIILLADADLGASAGRLLPLIDAVSKGADVSIAQFRTSGGFGVAKTIATWGIWLLTGRRMLSPLSGQRALSPRARHLLTQLPSGWGVEVAVTVQALWNGLDVVEVPLELTHRQTRKDLAGFVHRGRQCYGIISTLGTLAKIKRTTERSSL